MTKDANKKDAKPPAKGDPQAPSTDNVAAVWVKADTLTPWSKNPRKNDGMPAEKVAESIKRFGWGAPVLARQDGREVVAGHTRLKGCEVLRQWWAKATERERKTWHPDAVRTVELGEVPVRFGDWSDREAHLLAIADNRLNEKADWDIQVLQEVMGEFGLEDLDVAGWSKDDLEKMGADLELDDGGDDKEPVDDTAQLAIIIECDSEEQQEEILSELLDKGLRCKALI